MTFIPNKLLRHPITRAEIPRRVKGIRRVHLRARIAAVDDAAGVPEGPARGGCRAGDVGRGGLEEVELVGGVFVDGAAD